MRLDRQLRHQQTALLGSVGHVHVLRALDSERVPQSAPQLAAAAGLTPQGTRGVLDVLARQRLVKAYSDAITAKARGVVNQQDHQAAPRLLREVLGNRLLAELNDFAAWAEGHA